MAVQIQVKVDSRQLRRALNENGTNWAKSLEYATKDMRRKGPQVVAQYTRKVYNVDNSLLNPRAKGFKGGVSLSGGVCDLEIKYSGRMLTPTHFGMTPDSSAASYGAWGMPYTIRAQILKGRTVTLGHWAVPGTEGGAYGKKSPYMFLPGKVPPIQRIGGGWAHNGAKHKALKVISAPQMVGSKRHIDMTMIELQVAQEEILEKRLAKFGITF